MLTTYDKSIANVIFAVVALLALIFHWSIPGWFTETNILQAEVVIWPIVVGFIPNKVTHAQATQVLVQGANMTPTQAKSVASDVVSK